MENSTRLEHLKSSIDTLEELSNDLAARCDGWDKNNGDLNGSSDALKRFCSALRDGYRDILADGDSNASNRNLPQV